MEYDRIKKILLIDIFTIVIVVGVLCIANSYAYKQEYVTSTDDINGSVSSISFIKVKNIKPTINYFDNSISNIIRVENNTDFDKTIDIDMNILEITDNLKTESFKYVLLSSNDINFSNCNVLEINDNCNFIVNGDFRYANNNEEFSLIDGLVIPKNSIVYYKLALYIDGDNYIGDNEIYGVLDVKEY